jgi:DNA-binding beta-propeller fold protein YncE
MKNKLTKTKFNSPLGIAGQFFSRAACFGAVILVCASAPAQNLFVSGRVPPKNCHRGCGVIYKLSWDGRQSLFALGFTDPWDVAFDRAGNLFVVDYDYDELFGEAAVYKITPNGVRTIFASGLSYPSYLAADSAGNLFLADYDNGIIYKYKPTGSRAIFASGLYHPVGMAFDSSGNLFVADNNAGNIHEGSIYEYKPDGTRTTFAVLNPSDRPADLAFDSEGKLLMADLGGNIYRYVALRRHPRMTFGSVPNSAQSLACDSAGNLLVVDAGDVSGPGTVAPNVIYKFTQQGVRSTFAPAQPLGETFACLAFQPIPCCQ